MDSGFSLLVVQRCLFDSSMIGGGRAADAGERALPSHQMPPESVCLCVSFSRCMYFYCCVCADECRSCRLRIGDQQYPCALGEHGVRTDKREGDGCTPRGAFPLREVYFRADRVPSVNTSLPVSATKPDDGWCDDPHSPEYNRYVKLPFASSHERLWLDNSGVYDILAVVGYNDAPVVPGKGSAIFFHVASPNMGGTAGCISMRPEHLREVLQLIDPASTFMNIV
jgi:L,D-peptidoglycan transpeptidase YkuD (ErfK/YbiS/YcfS/YnhG family)